MITVASPDAGAIRERSSSDRPIDLPVIERPTPVVAAALAAASQAPESADARHALADALRATAHLTDAIACYAATIALEPARWTAHRDLGNVLTDLGRMDEGITALQAADALRPDEPSVLLGLARSFEKRGTPEDARTCATRLSKAADAHPKDARRRLYAGLAWSQVGALDTAIADVQRAVELDAKDAEAWDFLGMLLADRRDWRGACDAYDRALAIEPGRAPSLFYRATVRLRLGDLAGGLADYEARWDSPHFTTPRRDYGTPRWRGEPLAGRTLLIHTEQGLGDTLQFARFIAHARAAGAGRVIVECEDPLVRLLSAVPGVDAVVRRGTPLPAADLHVPLMSLATFAKATLDTLDPAPYLGVDQAVRLLPPRPSYARLRVGLVWEASRSGASFRAKSVPFDALTPLLEQRDIEFVALQKGPGAATLRESAHRGRVLDLGERLVDLRDTAEVLAQLDLVITVDTAVAHLAGAMGIPTWTLLAESSDWRWLLDRTDSPWYPTMRLFRQTTSGDWSTVIADATTMLAQIATRAPVAEARFAPRATIANDTHLLAAVAHASNGEFFEAANAYNAALMIDATSADVWNNFGVALANTGRIADSLGAFAKAVTLDASHADAARNLARVEAAVRTAPKPAPQGDPSRPRFGLDWQVGASSGWGIYGLNLVAHTLRRGEFTPIPFFEPETTGMTPLQRMAVSGLATARTNAEQEIRRSGMAPFPTLHALRNGLLAGDLAQQLKSTRRVGLVFFEDSRLDRESIARGRTYDRIVAGSGWNAEVLKAHGLDHTVLVIQGIDTSVFHPAPRVGWLAGRFVVFSGGKIEYRKGQDLVVAAFARFRQRHPDALLMVAWHNHWPQTMAELVTAGHVRDLPSVNAAGELDITRWLGCYGIPADAVLDLGLVPNAQMAPLVREADVALFPNRAEGGTNLVAMEALASGVPCIISNNTGHLDLTSDDHNIVLRHQGPCSPTPSFGGTDGWGESSVDEIVEALEFAYQQRSESLRRAANAAAVMAGASWTNQIDRLFEAIDDVLR